MTSFRLPEQSCISRAIFGAKPTSSHLTSASGGVDITKLGIRTYPSHPWSTNIQNLAIALTSNENIIVQKLFLCLPQGIHWLVFPSAFLNPLLAITAPRGYAEVGKLGPSYVREAYLKESEQDDACLIRRVAVYNSSSIVIIGSSRAESPQCFICVHSLPMRVCIAEILAGGPCNAAQTVSSIGIKGLSSARPLRCLICVHASSIHTHAAEIAAKAPCEHFDVALSQGRRSEW